MMMAPVSNIIVELADIENFIFGFNITVFGSSGKYTDTGTRRVVEFDSRVFDRFIGTVNGNRTSTGTIADITSVLIDFGIEIA
jgi:hypothetical protein